MIKNYILCLGNNKYYDILFGLIIKNKLRVKCVLLNETMGLEQDNIPDKYKINDIIICLYEVNNLQELTDNSICYINGSLAFFHDGTRIPIRDESNILQKIKDGMI